MDKRTFQALLVCFAISILYLNWIVPPPENQEASNPVVSNPVVFGTESTDPGDNIGIVDESPVACPPTVVSETTGLETTGLEAS